MKKIKLMLKNRPDREFENVMRAYPYADGKYFVIETNNGVIWIPTKEINYTEVIGTT